MLTKMFALQLVALTVVLGGASLAYTAIRGDQISTDLELSSVLNDLTRDQTAAQNIVSTLSYVSIIRTPQSTIEKVKHDKWSPPWSPKSPQSVFCLRRKSPFMKEVKPRLATIIILYATLDGLSIYFDQKSTN